VVFVAKLRVTLGSKKKFNRTILNLDGVQARIDRVTRRLEGESRARLARHRRTGEHGILVFRDRHTRVIELYAKTKHGAPMSIQFGHWQHGNWHPGLFILPTTGNDWRR
jgi:hypothetical protein